MEDLCFMGNAVNKWGDGLNRERHQSGLIDGELFPDDELRHVNSSLEEEIVGLIRRGGTALNLSSICSLEKIF